MLMVCSLGHPRAIARIDSFSSTEPEVLWQPAYKEIFIRAGQRSAIAVTPTHAVCEVEINRCHSWQVYGQR